MLVNLLDFTDWAMEFESCLYDIPLREETPMNLSTTHRSRAAFWPAIEIVRHQEIISAPKTKNPETEM